MLNDFHWGGINVKGLCKAVLPDIWMAFAVMVIAYICLGYVGNMKYAPSYTSSTVVAVYPFNKMYTPDDSSGALDTVSSVNEVFNSEMFRTGIQERLTGAEDFSLSSEQIRGTNILIMSVSSSSPENAYKVLRTALEYNEEISSHLVGDSHLEILTAPDFPLSASNDSGILKNRTLLALFMGFAMACFLVLMYLMKKTYKTASAIQKYYKNIRFFRIKASDTGKQIHRNKGKSRVIPNQEAMRKTAIELIQMLRAKKAKSIFITSSASGEGKTEITVSLARELVCLGKSVIILETDPENNKIEESVDFERLTADLPDESMKVIYADKNDELNDFSHIADEVENKFDLELLEYISDVVLVDGHIWTGSRDERIWKEAAGTSLAICRQDKADFNAVERMMMDLQENNSEFLGCVLYGF